MTSGVSALRGSSSATFDVRVARTADEFDEILSLRARVFRDEQGMVAEELSDGDDRTSVHVYVRQAGATIAIGRLSPPPSGRTEGQIAWVAVVPELRGNGAGTAVMRTLLEIADQHRFPSVLISAQTHALPFYRRLGFRPYGDRFQVKGIEHQYMERRRPNR